jgi:type I restriction enzyme S subunit
METKHELPSQWAWSTIEDIATYVSRGRAPKYTDSTGVPIINQRCIRWNGIDFGHQKFTTREAFERLDQKQQLQKGDVLWNSTGTGTIGRAAVYNGHPDNRAVCVDTHVTIIRTRSYEPMLLRHWISSRYIQSKLDRLQAGSTNQVELNREAVLGTAVPFPPIAEQTRILAKIDELFGEIEAGEQELERVREGLVAYRRALLKAAVTGELTRDWREANRRHETGAALVARIRGERERSGVKSTRARRPPDTLAIPSLREIPESWVWCTVGEAGDVSLGRQRAPKHHHGPNMRPYLRVANVLDDSLDLSDVAEMNFTPTEFEHYSLRPGDILLNEGQSPELVGRSAIYRGEIDGCCFQKTLLRFRPSGIATTDFAQIVFQYYLHSQKFRRLSPITTNMAHLTQVRFVVMEFPVPPLDEQRAIAERYHTALLAVRDVDMLIAREEREALRQSVLKAAFEGRLVPPDSRDEPAGDFLVRLRETNPADMPRSRRRNHRDAA